METTITLFIEPDLKECINVTLYNVAESKEYNEESPFLCKINGEPEFNDLGDKLEEIAALINLFDFTNHYTIHVDFTGAKAIAIVDAILHDNI